MAGADLDYAILGWSFRLNYVRPVGHSTFTNDPFGRGSRGSFSFHAVATPDGALTVFDATLSLDGDGWPWRRPHRLLDVRGTTYDRYRRALSPAQLAPATMRRPRLR